MKRVWTALIVFPAIFLMIQAWFPARARAHFGMVIPSANIVGPDNRNVTVTLSFSHPFAGKGMDLERPVRFLLVRGGERIDLTDRLRETRVMDHRAWKLEHRFKRPGVYQFVMEPKPYWEPAEDLYIIHYTKTIVGVFGDDQGWRTPVGLPMEIVPLTRPFGNYSGNSFSGRVLAAGKPLANATVEVEYDNRGGHLAAPSEYHVTQEVRTDDNGVFTFTCPWPGWWGFSALHQAADTIRDPQGTPREVEEGGVLWIHLDKPAAP